MSRTTE